MARHALYGLGLLLAGFLVWTCCSTVQDAGSLYANPSLMPPVFHVDGQEDTGSGVPIVQQGEFLWLLTVRHIRFPQTADGHQVVQVERHPTRDLALLKVKTASPLVPLARRLPIPGEKLRAIGWHLSDCLAMTDGRERPGDKILGNNYHAMTCPIMFGASGGAVLNEAGELVGIVKGLAQLTRGGMPIPISWLSYYIPMDKDAKDWIQRITRGP